MGVFDFLKAAVTTLCQPHRLAPFTTACDIGSAPDPRVLGLSLLQQIVQYPLPMGRAIASFNRLADPRGPAIICEAATLSSTISHQLFKKCPTKLSEKYRGNGSLPAQQPTAHSSDKLHRITCCETSKGLHRVTMIW